MDRRNCHKNFSDPESGEQIEFERPWTVDMKLGIALFLTFVSIGFARDFERQVLEPRYFSEGAAFGDINGDGQADAVAGPHWWAGPGLQS